MTDLKFERYRLVLHHDFVDRGEVREIDKPIVVQYCFDRMYMGRPFIINEMIEKLRVFMLNAIEAEET